MSSELIHTNPERETLQAGDVVLKLRGVAPFAVCILTHEGTPPLLVTMEEGVEYVEKLNPDTWMCFEVVPLCTTVLVQLDVLG
jgi:hypothetical protein